MGCQINESNLNEQSNWIKKNAKSLELSSNDNYADLQFLKPLLKDKRLLFLGETSHGVNEFNNLKLRIVKYLHQNLDFDVVVFESGFAETSTTFSLMKELDPQEAMKSAVYGTWYSQDMIELFSYIKEQYDSDTPLILTGVDINSLTSVRDDKSPKGFDYGNFLLGWLGSIDTKTGKLAYEAEYEYANVNNRTSEAAKKQLRRKYEKLLQFIDENQMELKNGFPYSPDILESNIEAIQDRIYVLKSVYNDNYLDLSKYKNEIQKMMAIRDLAMEKKLIYLLKKKYPYKKFVILGHNFHIMKEIQNLKMVDNGLKEMFDPMPQTLGTIIPDNLKKESYVLGLFIDHGSTTMSDGNEYMVKPKESSKSLEWIIKQAGNPISFVDFSQAKRTKGTKWMDTCLNAHYWGLYKYQLVPSEQFDGVILVEVASATKLLDSG